MPTSMHSAAAAASTASAAASDADPRYRHASQSFAWRAGDFASSVAFSLKFGAADRAEFHAAIARWNAGGRTQPVTELTRADYALSPALTARLEAAAREVRDGHGFVVLKGLPTEGLDIEQYGMAVWGIGLHFGSALSQNAQGERLTHVVDATGDDPTPRMYRSNLELRPHTDITAMIALASWNRSQSGGASVVTSAVTVHDEIRRRAPHLLAPLYRGYHYHRLGEEGPGEAPVTERRVPVFANRNGQISCRYLRSGIVGGQNALGQPVGEEDRAAMDLFDAIAADPANRLAFFLERGEMIVINNYTVMHARTRFVNYPEPERRRQLVRLWLDDAGFRDVPPEFNFFRTNGVPKQAGRRASYDFKKLYANDPLATGGVPDLRISDDEAARTR
ncbi:MAG: TauD/TfdA family dioxygenase [Lautropia sp.]